MGGVSESTVIYCSVHVFLCTSPAVSNTNVASSTPTLIFLADEKLCHWTPLMPCAATSSLRYRGYSV